jgi:hypothetical protein
VIAEQSVLIKATAPSTVPPLSDALRARLVDRLPGTDKWFQYPAASGRGHGFEIRFWVPAADPAEAAALGAELLEAALAGLHLSAWSIVRVHAASISERLRDRYAGLEDRLGREDECTALVRLEPPDRSQRLGPDELARLRAALPAGAEVHGERGAVELKFWVPARDAGEATERAEGIVSRAREAVGGLAHWQVMRSHVCTVAEATRLHYFGVDRRAR